MRVRVDDATSGSRLIDAVAKGPFFYASLLPGTYKVTVRYHGHAQTRDFVISGNNTAASYFYWP